MNVRKLRQEIAAYATLGRSERYQRCRRQSVERARCPVRGYLCACFEFDQGEAATAVREMMHVHHAEPDFESAALLVFAGLNWVPQPQRPLLDVLVETWDEFRRPQFDRTRKERMLLDAFCEPADGLQQISSLAVRLWRLPLQSVRAQLQRVAVERNELEHPLLLGAAG